MDENGNQENRMSNIIRIFVTVLFFLFVLSACILGMLLKGQGAERSIGAFLDLTPYSNRYDKFVIIGGRVFYPNKEATNYTFPKEPPEEMAVENTDDASEEVITLRKLLHDDGNTIIEDPAVTSDTLYRIKSYPLRDNRSKRFRDDVKWIELFTVTDGETKEWMQEADIDLFRNDEGRIYALAPGTKGFFRFQLNNKSGEKVHARMMVYEPETGVHLPMIFSLEDENNGVISPDKSLYMGESVELSFDIEKDSSGVYRLNWEWPYESGDDHYDGTVGAEAGQYILKTAIYAETVD